MQNIVHHLHTANIEGFLVELIFDRVFISYVLLVETNTFPRVLFVFLLMILVFPV